METEVPIRAGGWVDEVFDWCVRLLLYLADLFGMTYTEINIVIFCILWPIFTLGLVVVCGCLFRLNRKLKRLLVESRHRRTA